MQTAAGVLAKYLEDSTEVQTKELVSIKEIKLQVGDIWDSVGGRYSSF